VLLPSYCAASGELSTKEFEKMVMVNRNIALPLVVAELGHELTSSAKGYPVKMLLDEATKKGVTSLLPKALRSSSHSGILRIDKPQRDGEEATVFFSRGKVSLKSSEIKALVKEKANFLSFERHGGASPYRFEVSDEGIRDALCLAIVEMLNKEELLNLGPALPAISSEIPSSIQGASLSVPRGAEAKVPRNRSQSA
jgi:hypothetical protein